MIWYDNNMFDIVADKPSKAKTVDLIEELGQVEFIFSDKTGTLTQNVMEFKQCAIEDKIYGQTNNADINRSDIDFNINGDTTVSKVLQTKNNEKKNERNAITNFFRVMSVCHSAISEIKDGQLRYNVYKIYLRTDRIQKLLANAAL